MGLNDSDRNLRCVFVFSALLEMHFFMIDIRLHINNLYYWTVLLRLFVNFLSILFITLFI